MIPLQNIKQRFEIIGNEPRLLVALETAYRIAESDISALVIGESGVGKESIPKIIHQYSHRKHARFIAVNCGAIPEGTIDSELFGHEKGAFTGATQTRQGYFEVANKGTLFLDEVGELPSSTQVRLLRVLESGEFIKVGSSKVQKTDVRIIAATNVDIQRAVESGKFREDLYYRLCIAQIYLPPLRERREDILLLFRKFSSDFGVKYKRPSLKLEENAKSLLLNHRWPGNIRQLRNLVEQLSVLEINPVISEQTLRKYFNSTGTRLPAIVPSKQSKNHFETDREILYKLLFEMKSELNDLRELFLEVIDKKKSPMELTKKKALVERIYGREEDPVIDSPVGEEFKPIPFNSSEIDVAEENEFNYAETIEEIPKSLQEKEVEMIKTALERSNGRRRIAAKELGISERTLYRKIKTYKL